MKRKLILSLSILVLPIGVITTLGNQDRAFVMSEAKEEIDKTIYVDLSLNNKYLEEDAHPCLHYKNDVDRYVSLSLVNNNIYKTNDNIPIDVFINEEHSFEICCYGDEITTTWIKGNNVLKETCYNYIQLDSYIEGEQTQIKEYGYYGDKEIPPEEATYKTQRIWLYDNHEDNDYINVVGYQGSDGYKIINMKNVTNTYDSKIYYFIDIPYTVTSIYFLKMFDYKIIQHNHIENLFYGVCYTYVDLDITTTQVAGAESNILARVVEAYLTYGKDDSNGTTTATIRNLFNTWFANKSANDNDLKNAKIWDYTGYSKNGDSYEGLEKNEQFSIDQKWNTMCSQVNIDPKTGNLRNSIASFFSNKTVVIILIVGSIGLLMIGGFTIILIRKKKSA